MLCYSTGADQMSNWFYTAFPKSLFEKIATMSKTPPLPAHGEAGWVIFGGSVMAILLYLRQSLFFLPHPIGLIMLVNPIMRYYWFSIFIGWAAKAVVTRYGGKNTYITVRGLFIGLIAGELIMVTLAMLLSVLLDIPIRLDLNRNP
jgi:branched-subunit amino acid transport protein